jgi:hypothetical protein
MKPKIEHTEFGSITVEGETFDHDIVIRLDGQVIKRKKKLSKQVYGTSHIVSLDEAEYVFEKGADYLVVGSGQSGILRLSEEAQAFFNDKKVNIGLFATPEAIQFWNQINQPAIGLFHVTC